MDLSSHSEQIERNMTLHPPRDPAIGAVMDDLRAAAKAFAHEVDRLVPAGREKSMAITAAEDSLMYAIAGVARDQAALLPTVDDE